MIAKKGPYNCTGTWDYSKKNDFRFFWFHVARSTARSVGRSGGSPARNTLASVRIVCLTRCLYAMFPPHFSQRAIKEFDSTQVQEDFMALIEGVKTNTPVSKNTRIDAWVTDRRAEMAALSLQRLSLFRPCVHLISLGAVS